MKRTPIALLSTFLAVLLALSFVGSVSGSKLGDANGDNDVRIGDAMWVAKQAAGLNPTPFNPEAADVNGDGDVRIGDAMFIAKWCAELPVPYPIGEEMAIRPSLPVIYNDNGIAQFAENGASLEPIRLLVYSNTSLDNSYPDNSAPEGSTCIKDVSQQDETWIGFSIVLDTSWNANPHWVDLSAYSGYCLMFWVKTPVDLLIGMTDYDNRAAHDPSTELISNYGWDNVADNNVWTEICIPLENFDLLGDLDQAYKLFAVTTPGGVDNGTTIYIDYIRLSPMLPIVYNDHGIACDLTLTSWDGTANPEYPDNTAPEGTKSFKMESTATWAGWYVSLPTDWSTYYNSVDLSSYTDLKFWVKTPGDLKVDIRDNVNPGVENYVLISAHGWDNTKPDEWQEITIPISTWTEVDSTKIFWPFGAKNGTDVAVTYYIDNVRWA